MVYFLTVLPEFMKHQVDLSSDVLLNVQGSFKFFYGFLCMERLFCMESFLSKNVYIAIPSKLIHFQERLRKKEREWTISRKEKTQLAERIAELRQT